ncbi:WLM domain-containing protein [Aspergillus karnatakaensis]|uniref:putative zinc metalloproteinase n=1 Tax=Aspergillus karnatakaensis TaxID=1810916 RepID=UPI003CCE2837
MADEMAELTLTVNHQGTSHPITLPATATLEDLSTTLASTLHIPPETQKLLIAPKPGMQKAPFPRTPLSEILPLSSPKFKITLLGTPTQEITNLNTQGVETRKREAHRTAAQADARARHRSESRRAGGGVHTISSSSGNYTFHRLEPLQHLPNPSRSLTFLTRLRDDPGIRSAMANHKFSVPLLTEMDPAEHTTSESRTLGLNRNKGEVIELRLRTDAYDGYRDYRTIRKTLCHELAHCVFSEHDRDFWDLTKQIEGEVEKGDWKSGGRQVGEGEFYNPGDWESEVEGGHVHDERGWMGSSQILGGGNSLGSRPGSAGGGGMREVLARAAEERAKRAREEKRDPSS